jgi:hypothetical protein
LVAIGLSGASLGCLAQYDRLAVATTGVTEVEIEFTRARNLEDLRRLCATHGAEASGPTCSFSRRDGSSRVCVVVAIEPETFNDTARLVLFGREALRCLLAREAPQATRAR